MTQEYITVTGYGTVHIDIILVGAKVSSANFRYALMCASEQRLRRIIGDLEANPGNNVTRINKLKARLADLKRMNAANAAYASLASLAYDSDSVQPVLGGGE